MISIGTCSVSASGVDLIRVVLYNSFHGDEAVVSTVKAFRDSGMNEDGIRLVLWARGDMTPEEIDKVLSVL